MIRAKVIGPVWATKRAEHFPAGALLEIQELSTDRRIIALDQLGAGPGETVLVTMGSGVSRHLAGRAPVDALVVGVIDELSPTIAEPGSPGSSPIERKSHE